MIRWLIGIIIALLAAAAASVLVVPKKFPDVSLVKQEVYPPFNEMIPLVIRDDDGASDLYLVHPGVGTEVRLSHAGRNEELPVLSPSGNALLFRSWHAPFWSLWLAHNNGDEALVSESAAEPLHAIFSLDETKMIVFENESDSMSASVIDLAGATRERIAKNVRTAAWLADGRGIVVLATQDDGQDTLSVRRIGLDGSLDAAEDVTTGAWWLLGSRASSRFLVFAKFDDGVSIGEVASDGVIERLSDFSITGTPIFYSGELSPDGKAALFTYATSEEQRVTTLYSFADKELIEVSKRAFDARFVGATILMKEVSGQTTDVMLFDPETRQKRRLSEQEGITY